MARPLRIQFEGAIYHVTVRGNARQAIYLDEADQHRFLARLSECVTDYRVRLHLFCLMPNHFHLLVETPKANVSAFMGSLLTGYTVYFNRRHRRVGHLTQGRFGARLVEGNEYLLKLSRYVHLNPAFTEGALGLPLERRLAVLREHWASSYPGYAGAGPRHAFVTYAPILGQVAGEAARAEEVYRAYVEGGLVQGDDELVLLLHRGGTGIGAERFQDRMRQLYQARVEGGVRKEDAAFRVRVGVVRVEAVMEAVDEGLGKEPGWRGWRRPVLAYLLCRHAGLTQRATAEAVGVGTGAAVSQQVTKVKRAMAADAEVREKISAIETRLGVSP